MARRAKAKTYGIPDVRKEPVLPAPDVPYKSRSPKFYAPKIGLIGCGGITESHLRAYTKAGFNVAALCDRDLAKAEARRKEFYPEAEVYSDYHALLKRDDIEVLDIALHPVPRAEAIEAGLNARRHVLSQKPFVLDLDKGLRFVDLAEKKQVKLAVNQNGRWAPHVSYMRHCIDAGLIGVALSAHLSVDWDHNWTEKSPAFNSMRHLILYDFAIHWFDMIACYFRGQKATRVYAALKKTPVQRAAPPLLADVVIEFEAALATLSFGADTRFGSEDHTFISGSKGSLRSTGPDLNRQSVTVFTEAGSASPKLEGTWFPDGFWGTMGELLCAIEEKREPDNSARDNLRSLELAFAAARSADTGNPMKTGSVRVMPV